jgi:hypothetical protein
MLQIVSSSPLAIFYCVAGVIHSSERDWAATLENDLDILSLTRPQDRYWAATSSYMDWAALLIVFLGVLLRFARWAMAMETWSRRRTTPPASLIRLINGIEGHCRFFPLLFVCSGLRLLASPLNEALLSSIASLLTSSYCFLCQVRLM